MKPRGTAQDKKFGLWWQRLVPSARLVWDLARKDLALFLMDPKAAALCFAIPIVLGLIFGKIFENSQNIEANRLAMLLVNEDDHPLTLQLVQAMVHSKRIHMTESTRADAEAALTSRRARVALIIPHGMGQSLSSKSQVWRQGANSRGEPALKVLHTPDSVLEGSFAEGLVTEIVWKEMAGRWLGSVLPPGATPLFERPFQLEQKTYPDAHAGFNSFTHSFCGMSLQYLLFWGMDSGLMMLRERRRGVWRRVRAAPLTLTLILAGRVTSTTLIAFAQVLVTMTFAWVFCGVAVNGSLFGFFLMAFAASLMAASTGMLVAAMGQSEARARNLAVVAILGLSMIGGYWLPSFLFPDWVRIGSLALPTTWALRGFEGVFWGDGGLLETLRCAAVVGGFSLAFLAIAGWWLAMREKQGLLEGATP